MVLCVVAKLSNELEFFAKNAGGSTAVSGSFLFSD
jgi:hypothetical protein